MEQPNWKSPRRIAQDIHDYQRTRFESYMQMEERGELTRGLALTALREEISFKGAQNERTSMVGILPKFQS